MVARKTIEGRTTVDGRADERKVFAAGTVEWRESTGKEYANEVDRSGKCLIWLEAKI